MTIILYFSILCNICWKWKKLQEFCYVRKRLRKRKREETDNQPDVSEENSEDGSITKGSENTAKSSTNEIQDTINISDDDESRNDVRREPSRFEPSMEPKQIEKSAFKSVRDYFGEDEAVYIMDAKTTGNIGRYLNVSKKNFLSYYI